MFLLVVGGVCLCEGKGELNLWLILCDFVLVVLIIDLDLWDVCVDGVLMFGVVVL